MNTNAAKRPVNKNLSDRNNDSQNHYRESTFQFVDNRPESIIQRKLNEISNNNNLVRQTAQLKFIANSRSINTIQKQRMEEEELLQGKFETIQKKEPEEEELLQGKFLTIQKQPLEEDELLQGKFETIQKQALEEEKLLQGKFDPIQMKMPEEEELLQGKFETVQKKDNKTGLPDNLKSGIENLSGYTLDDVNVNYNSDKPAQLNAHAYAQGTDIHVAPGQEKHLPHEA